jgi:enamine deaminase RidA (YjgF/YER057c/UK114 family)
VLAAAGAKLSDKVHVLRRRSRQGEVPDHAGGFGPVWGELKPAWTPAPVPALALEGMRVEIDVVAVVPR